MQDDTECPDGHDDSKSVVISSDSGEDLDDPVKVHLLCNQNERQDNLLLV